MSTAKKFMFDLAFDENVDPLPEPEVETNDDTIAEDQETEIIIPTYSEEDLETARQLGYKAGKEEGLAATEEILSKQINETLIKIDEKLIVTFENLDNLNYELMRAAHSLALSICKKMMPSMAKQSSFSEVKKVIEEVFSEVLDEALITIAVHVDVVEAVEARLTELANEKEFKGRLQVKSDETIEISDCKIDWANGGTERNTSELWANIETILKRNIGENPTIWDNPEKDEKNDTFKSDEKQSLDQLQQNNIDD